MTSKTKVAIVTGGGSGIGKACVLRYAREGYKVGIIDIADSDGMQTEAQVLSEGYEAKYFHGDVSSENDCMVWAQAIFERWGRIDALVANAGVQINGDLFSATDADWDKIVGVNLKGVAFSCKAVLSQMIDQKRGAIVLVSSINALEGVAGGQMPLYDMSKAGVLGLMRSLANQYGKQGIRVNAICPGVTVTEFHEKKAAERGKSPEDLRENLKGHALLGKGAEPAQIASAIYFLNGEDASHITGQILTVDGGLTAMSHPI
jgi:meso-butanediol dehydrogenase/(S,S)-butanediol dehydrogenase/diacetyl reductase